ncbi:hypothetical protein [Mammaliicoccus sciuri]|uniref:hypothetical protein n=1 Tax=Mammaliicoccus sciuri TaxID=1296 RepID=UPI00265CB24B|nr:hypothetical protein [Mammaliicoccus sciuri]
MKKILILFMILVIFVSGCGDNNSEKKSSTKKNESKKEIVKKEKKKDKNKEKVIEDQNSENSSEYNNQSDNNTDQQKNLNNNSKINTNVNPTPEQCILSGLTNCNCVTIEQQYDAYKSLVANGTLPQGTPGSGNLAQAVQDSFDIKNGKYNNWEEINDERRRLAHDEDDREIYYDDTVPNKDELVDDEFEYNNISNDNIIDNQNDTDSLLEDENITQSE